MNTPSTTFAPVPPSRGAPPSPRPRNHFRRLFPNVRPDPRGADEAADLTRLRQFARRMIEKQVHAHPKDEFGDLPAAYTYLGQFIAHDVAFAATNSFDVALPDLVNRRTPELDLDSLYGRGPIEDPQLYEGPCRGPDGPFRFRIGSAYFDETENNVAESDLPRTCARYADVAVGRDRGGLTHAVSVLRGQRAIDVEVRPEDVVHVHGRARIAVRESNQVRTAAGFERANPAMIRTLGTEPLIGDARNDDNLVLSQLHLAFLRFHNEVFDEVRRSDRAMAPRAVFEKSQRLVRWHYQWLVVNDYLRRIVLEEDWARHRKNLLVPGTKERVFGFDAGDAFLPAEFAFAAFRFGHSMVRESYELNSRSSGARVATFVPEARPPIKSDLRGRGMLPDVWTVQWGPFLTTQTARRISEHLGGPMASHAVSVDGRSESLPYTTLVRGWRLELPSGQDLARALEIVPLEGPPEPLWFYVLREARERGGGRLGPLGARIVAETLLGLVRDDPTSFVHATDGGRSWTPTLGRVRGKFDLEDLLRKARAPISDADFRSSVFGAAGESGARR